MAEQMRLVKVDSDGQAGDLAGTITFSDDSVLSGDSEIAQDTVDMFRRRSNRTDPQIFAFLGERGWSNGHIMIQR